MKMLIWKELRENFKWAFLAMLVLGMAELHALYQTPYGGIDYNFNDGITICKTSFLTVTTFGCATIGFLLGLIQILPELKRDRWAALLHRPVERGVIFRGKVVAGILLYLLATAPPFLLSIWLAATPGYFGAPFLPEMACPGTIDLCMGMVYYFAGIAVALQKGGWSGLKVFPLFAAISTSFFIGAGPFYVAFEAVFVMALALVTAAWGAMYNQELFRARPWQSRVAFMAIIFYGTCGFGYMLQSFIKVVEPATHSKYTQYVLTDDGVPILMTSLDEVVTDVRDLNGNPLTDVKFKLDRVRNHIRYLNIFSQNIGDDHGWHRYVYQESYRESRNYLWSNGPYSYPRMEQWFYAVAKKYYIGFLPQQKLPFALLDEDGFEPPSATPKGFTSEAGYSGQSALWLWSPTRMRYIEMAKHQITEIPLPAPGPIYGSGYAWATSGNSSVSVTGMTFKNGIAVYDDKATFMTFVPFSRDTDHWGQIQFGLNWKRDRFYIWYSPSAWIDDVISKSMPSYVDEVTATGQVLHSFTLPPLPNNPNPTALHDYLWLRLQSPVFWFGEMAYKKVGAAFGSTRMKSDLSWQWSPVHALKETVSISIFISSLSALLAVVAFFWARRVHFSRRRACAWALFVFGFGLPGFVTFRLANDWPRFVSCFRCHKSRPIEADHCPHCGDGWPTPLATGIEIFEPAEKPLTATISN